MKIAVLGASGATGRLLVAGALARGLTVTALARDPGRIPGTDHAGLFPVAADVYRPRSIADAVVGCDVLLSGLGVPKGGRPDTLVAGAAAAIGSGVPRVVWLGAYGTGRSARAAGALTRALLGVVLRSELADKVSADDAVLDAGGTVFHSGPLTNGPAATAHRTLALDDAPRRLLPAAVSRATVAAAMLDEAVHPRFPGRIAVPVAG
ncbi:NAD(P)-dependent oxidoreductase [Jidongwangia harbinensis]|uniref:NAD(P)-dependent oxidoreductase n=1 Tax=Jidongwangia harbinensis TaxID=2878561 RepID=UPI001CD94FF1|nr:NAD(P)H-binding protein [Jidongwangia harbinensis]MCA2216568.1 NAD(P)H-binding protein [Jidongwangia harbinensis]